MHSQAEGCRKIGNSPTEGGVPVRAGWSWKYINTPPRPLRVHPSSGGELDKSSCATTSPVGTGKFSSLTQIDKNIIFKTYNSPTCSPPNSSSCFLLLLAGILSLYRSLALVSCSRTIFHGCGGCHFSALVFFSSIGERS